MRTEAGRLREDRDSANQEAASIKQRIGQLRNEAEEKRKRLEELDSEVDQDRSRLPSKRRLASRLGHIEWEIMTTPTVEMLPKEKEIADEAKELEMGLTAHADLDIREDEGLKLLAEIKAIGISIQDLRKDAEKLHERGTENHEKMIALRQKASEERERANDAHAKFVERIQTIRTVREELAAVRKEIRAIRGKIGEAETLTRAEKKQALEAAKKEMVAEAKRKFNAGKKLTLDELKLLYEGEGESEEEE